MDYSDPNKYKYTTASCLCNLRSEIVQVKQTGRGRYGGARSEGLIYVFTDRWVDNVLMTSHDPSGDIDVWLCHSPLLSLSPPPLFTFHHTSQFSVLSCTRHITLYLMMHRTPSFSLFRRLLSSLPPHPLVSSNGWC